uniref:glycoside hydrolase family 38 N-terminal domain-containing protein n=1 Tax=Candidatus Stercorousia sp. TaxID=3048886 RepID=UPI004027548D
MKKQVIAYLHTHWDREWYREFEVFRLRLLRVFDNVLEMLENNKIPSFYFDGQVSALLDYLEIRPEKEGLVRKFIAEKKLYIGPCYTLVDEFLTDKTVFEKNLEIGLKISKDFGCTDFIGYLADTFGHSQNIPKIFKDFGIDKCVVWRGCGDIPSEFSFNGINTVNLIRGYFMDIFSAPMTIEQKAEWLKGNLDKIAEKSGNYLLLPIGADHLGVEPDITEQIEKVNSLLDNYEIKLSNPFEYFELVKDNFKQFEWNDELRDNSKTFILQGSYSARLKLKQYNVKCTYLLEQADKLQKKYGEEYNSIIEYAYKLLLKNQAHDGICGCSTDLVHRENITRYEKIIQITNSIIEELRLKYNFKTPIMESKDLLPEYKVIGKHFGVENSLLYNTQKIPVTEDFTDIYTLKYSPAVKPQINFEVKNGKIRIGNFEMEFVRFKDEGDTYNFGAVADDIGEKAEIYSFKNNIIKTSFFDIKVEQNEELINFKIEWDNKLKNKLWQVKFNLKSPVTKTYSEDLNSIIKREFDPDYDMRKHLPKVRGIEVKTNFAPIQRYVGTQGFGVITKGLTEYEVKGKSLLITLLRSTGVISNPKNPSRSTPAGPPIEVPEAQQLGTNSAEFSVGFFEPENYQKYIDIVFPQIA